MLVVFGATERCGGAVAHAFLERGVAVRALVRSPERAQDLRRRGAEICVGDLAREADVRTALEGATTVFHAGPLPVDHPDPVAFELEAARRIVDAAKAVGVQHHIFLSSLGADQHTGVPQIDSKARIEDWIKSAGLPYTFLRAGLLMDDFKSDLDAIRTGRLLGAARAEVAVSLVAAQDVAKAAWASFRAKKPGAAFELVGPRPVTFVEVAEAFGLALGRRVSYQSLAPQAWADPERLRVSPRYAELLVALYECVNRGGFVGNPTALLRALGVRPISIIDFALGAVR